MNATELLLSISQICLLEYNSNGIDLNTQIKVIISEYLLAI